MLSYQQAAQLGAGKRWAPRAGGNPMLQGEARLFCEVAASPSGQSGHTAPALTPQRPDCKRTFPRAGPVSLLRKIYSLLQKFGKK